MRLADELLQALPLAVVQVGNRFDVLPSKSESKPLTYCLELTVVRLSAVTHKRLQK